MYHTPQASAQYFHLMLEHIEAARDCCDELILMGDFNIDLQKNHNSVNLPWCSMNERTDM